jgi:hypothetical protein
MTEFPLMKSEAASNHAIERTGDDNRSELALPVSVPIGIG